MDAKSNIARLALWSCLLGECLLTSGCVLPGGDRPVGAMRIEGRVCFGTNPQVVGDQVVVVRKHVASQQQLFDALFSVGDPACNPAKRYAVPIRPDGTFSVDLPSFLSGDPIWVIPPLFTLVPFGGRADKQGLVFLMRTTQPEDRTYEIDARATKPLVRICLPDRWRFRALTDAEKDLMQVTASDVRTNLAGNFSMNVRRVVVRISKP